MSSGDSESLAVQLRGVARDPARLQATMSRFFDSYDSDGNRTLDENEFVQMASDFYTHMHIPADQRPAVADLRRTFQAADVDRSGTIELNEFTPIARNLLEEAANRAEAAQSTMDSMSRYFGNMLGGSPLDPAGPLSPSPPAAAPAPAPAKRSGGASSKSTPASAPKVVPAREAAVFGGNRDGEDDDRKPLMRSGSDAYEGVESPLDSSSVMGPALGTSPGTSRVGAPRRVVIHDPRDGKKSPRPTSDDSLINATQEDLEAPLDEAPPKKSFLYIISHPKEWKERLKTVDWRLLIFLVFLIIFGLGNKITLKKMTIPMRNYPYFLSQLTTVVYIPVFWIICIILKWKTNLITKEMESFPKFRFFVMGTLDAVAGILTVFGVTGINGPMSVLLSQGAIPVTMLASFIFLKARYKLLQIIGSSIIMGGIITVLIPSLLQGGSGNSPLWAMVFFLSNVPTALSSVYKEKAFKGADIDVFYLNLWVAIFQFLVGLVFAVPSAPVQGTSIKDIPRDMYRGLLCWATGENFIHDGPTPDICGPALWTVNSYMLFNIAYNIFLVAVLKYGSAALMFIASTVVIPLANIAFTLKIIMGDDAQPLRPTDIAGLIIILVGLVIYRSVQEGVDEKQELHSISLVGPGAMMEFVPVAPPKAATLLPTRSAMAVRKSYLNRIGIAAPPSYGSTASSASPPQPRSPLDGL